MSEPTQPGLQAPPPPETRDAADKQPPVEVKRAITLYTATAAFLVFIGVTSLFLLRDAERALREQLSQLGDDERLKAIDPGLIRGTLIMVGIAIIVVAVGHGLTAQGLRDRKSWARPVGFTFSGILLGVAGLGAIAGAINIQTLFFLVAGLSGILSLAKPAVRDYLRPWPKHQSFPPNGPQGPGSWPPNGPQDPGSWPPNGPQGPGSWPPRGPQGGPGAEHDQNNPQS